MLRDTPNNESIIVEYGFIDSTKDDAKQIRDNYKKYAEAVVKAVSEYKGIKYKFYKDCLVCENTFLSQTKKTIEYSNIREVEIRRTFLDRIMNFGVIIIYTNADKTFGSATVLYAVKNTVEKYNNIESLIHNKNISSGPIKVENEKIDNEISNTNPVEEYTQDASNDIDPISENK